MSITFYHNPRCSKSRQVHALLEEAGKPYTVIEYLYTGFTRDQLATLIHQLDGPAAALVRTGDSAFKVLDINSDALDDDAVIDLLMSHPNLFQRPVVVAGNSARVGRPPKAICDIL